MFDLTVPTRVTVPLDFGVLGVRVVEPLRDPISLDLGLVAYYPFWEGSGSTVEDVTPNRNHGTLVNSPTWVEGRFGKALDFDESNYVRLNVNSWIRSISFLTIAGWYYHAGASNGAPWGLLTDTIIADADGFWWHLDYGGPFYLRTEDSISGEQDGTFTPFVSIGNWYHIVTIIGTNTFKVYVNGNLYTDWNPTFNWANINADVAYLDIGRSYDSGIHGIIDEIRVYNRALSLAEVKALYLRNAEEDYAQPVAYWPFHEGVGSIAEDITPNKNDGTITGATWINDQGSCLSFDGSDDYVDCGNVCSLPEHGTLMFWMKPTLISNYRNPFSSKFPGEGSMRFEMYDNQSFFGYFDSTIHTYAATINVDTWYHVVAVWDQSADNIKGYLNGNLVFNEAQTRWNMPFDTVQIGRGYSTDAVRHFKGSIDEVKIFNRALTASEVYREYYRGARGV